MVETPSTVADCCKALDPCAAICLLNNVLVDLAVGKFVTAYSVGDERYSFAKPSIADVERLLVHFQKLCNVSKGLPSRRRAKVCFIFDDNNCASCSRTGCQGCKRT